MSNYKKIANYDEIGKEGLKVEIDDEEILLVKDGENVYAISNICSHQEKELFSGSLENGAWVCPHHGARFDLITGESLSMPAVEGIKTYKVKIINKDVFIERDTE